MKNVINKAICPCKQPGQLHLLNPQMDQRYNIFFFDLGCWLTCYHLMGCVIMHQLSGWWWSRSRFRFWWGKWWCWAHSFTSIPLNPWDNDTFACCLKNVWHSAVWWASSRLTSRWVCRAMQSPTTSHYLTTMPRKKWCPTLPDSKTCSHKQIFIVRCMLPWLEPHYFASFGIIT